MEKPERFEHDGEKFEILKPGVKYIPVNPKRCIQEQEKSPIGIKKAVKDLLIRQVECPRESDLFGRENINEKYSVKTYQPEIRELDSPEATIGTERQSFQDYFMPVDKLRAQVFLIHGLIYPAIYDKEASNTNFADCQTRDCLTFFNITQPLLKNQVLLRVRLRLEEIQEAESSPNMLRFFMPLPISRLVGIEIPVMAGDLNRYIDGWIAPDLPVPPRRFFFIAEEPSTEHSENQSVGNSQTVEPDPEIEKRISKFDQYLGAMAFWRNADRYVSEKLGYYSDYPDRYIEICKIILDHSSVDPADRSASFPFLLALLDLKTPTLPTLDSIVELAKFQDPYIEKDVAREFAKKIYNSYGKFVDLQQAFASLFNGDYRASIQKLQETELPIEAAILAALYQNSLRSSNDHRTVKQRLHEDWRSSEHRYAVLAALGSYYGYTKLDARENTLYSLHSSLNSIEKCPDIKFHLATKFERELIESLYQKAFQTDNLDLISIYSDLATHKTVEIIRPDALMPDSSYYYHEMRIRRYGTPQLVLGRIPSCTDGISVLAGEQNDDKGRGHEISPIEKILEQLAAWNRESVDQDSESGKYLFLYCFRFLEDRVIKIDGGEPPISYKIAKTKLIELIRNRTITPDLDVLGQALEKDIQGQR